MSQTLTIELAKPVRSAVILKNQPHTRGGQAQGDRLSEPDADAQNAADQSRDLTAEKGRLLALYQTLEGLCDKLSGFYEELFAGHSAKIADLAVEIARKILVREVEEGNYSIQSIVEETIKNSPTTANIVVRLNPADLSKLEKFRQQQNTKNFAGIEFAADPAVGAAECVLESPKGMVESLIEKQLQRIDEALKKVQ